MEPDFEHMVSQAQLRAGAPQNRADAGVPDK